MIQSTQVPPVNKLREEVRKALLPYWGAVPPAKLDKAAAAAVEAVLSEFRVHVRTEVSNGKGR